MHLQVTARRCIQRTPPPFAHHPNAKPRRFRPTMSIKHLSPVGLKWGLTEVLSAPAAPRVAFPLCLHGCVCTLQAHVRRHLALLLATASAHYMRACALPFFLLLPFLPAEVIGSRCDVTPPRASPSLALPLAMTAAPASICALALAALSFAS